MIYPILLLTIQDIFVGVMADICQFMSLTRLAFYILTQSLILMWFLATIMFPVWMIHGLAIMNVKRVLCCQVYPVRMINIFSAYKIHPFNILTLREKMGGHLDEISISLTNLNSHRTDYSIDSFNKHRQYLLTSAVYSLKNASNLRLKSKRLKRPISYYNNSSATHRLLLIIAGVEQTPGPISKNKSRETQRKAPPVYCL